MIRKNVVTTAQILEKVKGQMAPLPSQAAYMKDLAGFYISTEIWEKYNKAYTPWLCRNVKSALESISDYLLSKHGKDRIRFAITKT